MWGGGGEPFGILAVHHPRAACVRACRSPDRRPLLESRPCARAFLPFSSPWFSASPATGPPWLARRRCGCRRVRPWVRPSRRRRTCSKGRTSSGRPSLPASLGRPPRSRTAHRPRRNPSPPPLPNRWPRPGASPSPKAHPTCRPCSSPIPAPTRPWPPWRRHARMPRPPGAACTPAFLCVLRARCPPSPERPPRHAAGQPHPTRTHPLAAAVPRCMPGPRRAPRLQEPPR